ncbi:MAG: DUF4347 domain-containing protein [Cyanobacteria bacterium P01_G01_bin.54]
MNITLDPPALVTPPTTALVVIDPRVPAPQSLLAGLRPGATALLLDPHQDGVVQITAALAQGHYNRLHLVAHGAPGALRLGSSQLSLATLPAYRQSLLEWGVAEIWIYGCNVAAQPEFLQALHQLTGAALAASTETVGQGNWALTWQIGTGQSVSAFTPELEQTYTGTFPDAELNLIDLDGSNGFVLNGIDIGDRSGISVSHAGDINGDGIADLIIGASDADPNGNSGAGESYVVFGGNTIGSNGALELSSLDGSNGFILNGVAADDSSGRSVSRAGDVNNDGIDDLIIGAPNADSNGNLNTGESYVVFGGTTIGSNGSFELSSLDGSNGFVLNGIDAFDQSGRSVSHAGDVNGDGIADLIIGATGASPNGNVAAGESYVVFGENNLGSNGSFELNSLDGSNGFVLNGIDELDLSGGSVSRAGDVNGDGIDDLIIGAEVADPNGNLNAGESYVVFGGNNVGGNGSLELSSLDGSNGFVLNGIDADDLSGVSVSSAGDVNGDGVNDLIIGAPSLDLDSTSVAGESYVVFGGTTIGGNGALELSSLDGSNGFVINGVDARDLSGRSVSGAGDVNGDGFADLVIGAPAADPDGKDRAGESYVVFGGNTIGSNGSFELSSLNGSNGFVLNGFVLNGADAGDGSGWSVSDTGDVNGDGIDDLIIGASVASPNGKILAGESYVIFGVRDTANAAPTFTSPATAIVPENQLAVIDIDATDDTNSEGSGLTYSITGGEDAALFEIDAVTGELSFITAPDFENPGDVGANNTYTLQITVTDAEGLTDSQDLVVTVTDVIENTAPTIITTNTANVAEGQTSVLDINTTDDFSSEGAGLTYSITDGDDAALFEIDAVTGELSFITAPDFENPGDVDADNIYTLQVTVTDAGGLTAVQDLAITVTNAEPLTLRGTPQADLLIGGAENDVLIGKGDNDTLLAGNGNDQLFGDSGDDLLDGGDGNDTLRGGNGNDQLLGGAGNDTLNGENGNDDLFGGEGNDSLRGKNGDDLLDAGAGEDSLLGGNGNDTLLGGADDDSLYGDRGDDLLDGGLGNDYVHGGSGADIYVLAVGAGFDTFAGFKLSRGDRIGLAGGLSFGQLEIHSVGGYAQISVGAEALAVVRGVSAAALIAAADTAFTVV